MTQPELDALEQWLMQCYQNFPGVNLQALVNMIKITRESVTHQTKTI